MRPQGTGIVELHDTKQNERGFFCMKLVGYLNEEAQMGTEAYAELWDERFSQAKTGLCAYRDKCPIHARTIENMKKDPRKRAIQYTLNFDF